MLVPFMVLLVKSDSLFIGTLKDLPGSEKFQIKVKYKQSQTRKIAEGSEFAG